MTRSHTTSSPRANANRTRFLVRKRISQSQHRVFRKTVSALMLTTAGCLIALSSSGCSSCNYCGPGGWLFSNLIEQPVANYRERIWAKRAFNLRYANCQDEFPGDFRAGFIEGYCNTCQGGDSHAPPLPPETYWTSRYTTEEGSGKVDSWFAGYPAGAKAAQADGNGKYHQIKVSSELQAAMNQIRNTGEDVVSIDSIDPVHANPPVPDNRLPNHPMMVQDVQPGGSPYPVQNYQQTDDSLPPIIRSNRAFPVSNPGTLQSPPMNQESYSTPGTYGAPLGAPGGWYPQQ